MITRTRLLTHCLLLVAGTILCATGTPAQPVDRTISTSEAHVQLRGATKNSIAAGGDVAHLNLYDTVKITINAGAKVSHATAHDRARVEVRGGKVSILTLLDGSSGVLDEATIEGGLLTYRM